MGADSERKVEIEKLVNKLPEESFAEFVQIGQRITDYSAAEEEAVEETPIPEIDGHRAHPSLGTGCLQRRRDAGQKLRELGGVEGERALAEGQPSGVGGKVP